MRRYGEGAANAHEVGLIGERSAHTSPFDVAQAIDRLLALDDREWRAEYHARYSALDDARKSLDEAIEAGDERAIGRARDSVAAMEQNLRRWLEGVIEEAI